MLVRRPYRFGNPFDWRVYGHQGAVERHAAWIVSPQSKPISCGKVIYYPSTVEEITARLGRVPLVTRRFCQVRW